MTGKIDTKYWTLLKRDPTSYSAVATKENNLCIDEVRCYSSREAIEHDFGPLEFPDEQVETMKASEA